MDGVDFRFFCTQFMAALMYRYLRSEGEKAENDFESLRMKAKGMIPKTVSAMDKVSTCLDGKKNEEAYGTLLEITSVFKQETGKNCVVILDEFHNLSNFKLRRPFQVFGKFIMVQKNTMYIVSSSQKSLLKDILTKKLSLLFGNFEVLEIDGFDNQTARSFVSEKIKDVDIAEDIKSYLIQITQGNPFYLENLASKVSEIKRKESTREKNDEEYLLDSLAYILYESNGVLNQYFMNNVNFFLEKKNRKKFLPILVALSHGKQTIKDIQAHIGKTDKDTGLNLQKLQDMDLVLNSGTFYYVADKLFEYWLKHVYDLKSRSVIDDMGIKYLEFKKEVSDDYRRYCVFSQKKAADIIYDLFKSFSGEKMQINMNMKKMPKFDSVEKKKLSDTVFQIIGKKGKRAWVCNVKQNDISDDKDIHDIWSMKFPDKDIKIMRKIFVPLKGIEQNAYLLAKEQNVWVWDQKQLNVVLRLFGKFEIVK